MISLFPGESEKAKSLLHRVNLLSVIALLKIIGLLNVFALKSKKEERVKKLSLVLVIAIVCLSLGVFSTSAFAEGEATGLSMTKIPDIDSASLGDTITYTYTITNMSTDNITDIALEDDKLGPITLITTSLEPDESTTVISTHVVVISDFTDPIAPDPIENVATVTGTDLSGEPVTASASASVALSPYASSLEVRKEADTGSASLHDTITYTYTITNSGDISIDGIALEDDKLGPITLTTTSLGPGEEVEVVAPYTILLSDLEGETIVNTASVQGTDEAGNPVSALSNTVSVSLVINKSLMTKAEILKLSGVPGKGIYKAPGLQKPFNPKSRAAEHAGKKK